MSHDLWDNPMGTDGFEFIEYAAPDPDAMAALFVRMGFTAIARHRHKNVTLFRQGGINFILNAEPDSFAQRFARLHGPSICAIAFRVQDAAKAYRRALDLGAWGFDGNSGPGAAYSMNSKPSVPIGLSHRSWLMQRSLCAAKVWRFPAQTRLSAGAPATDALVPPASRTRPARYCGIFFPLSL